MELRKMTCLQIHNDYQIPGGETKTAIGIANLLEEYGVKVIRYYKSNSEFADYGLAGKVKVGINSLYNPATEKELNHILDSNSVDFALIHNVMPVISNSVYAVLKKRNIPIIKYIQNYNLICLNGAIDQGSICEKCKKCLAIGVQNKCYKGNSVYSFIRYLAKIDLDKHYLQYIDAFMPNSNFVKEKHVQYGLNPLKMNVMYNYIANNAEVIKGDNHSSFYLYFGRISKEKGIFTILKAFKELENIQLKIMGSGELEEDINEYIEEHNLNNVKFIGSRTGEELDFVIGEAKCVIVSSEWEEPLPRTIIESYAQGIPVIGTDLGGIPEMIKEKETGLIYTSGSAEALKEAVIYMERLAVEEYDYMRKNCIVEVAEKYSKESYFGRFMKCVEKIVL